MFSGAGGLVAVAEVIRFPAPLAITELEPAGGRFVGKTVTHDGHIEQYSSGAWFRQRVASIPATIPALFKYLHSDARQRNVFLIRGAPANAERRRTRRQIAYRIHDGVDRKDHGFIDTPTALFVLDFDGVQMPWQADPERAVKDIVMRLGTPYSNTDFVWFFSSSHGLKLDKNKAWHGKLSDTDVRVRVAFIAERPLDEAEATALTKTLKARSPDLKLDPAVSRLMQPNYIQRPRWQGHPDRDVLGDIPTIGLVQGGAKLLAVPDEIAPPETIPGSPGEGNVTVHPDAETAVDAIGSDGSIRSHLHSAVGHLLQNNPSANEASVVTELRAMVDERRAALEPALKRHSRKWVEVKTYLDDAGRYATWWIARNRPHLKPGIAPKNTLESDPIATPARDGFADTFAGFLTNKD